MALNQVTVFQLPTEAGTHFPGQRLAPEAILEGKVHGASLHSGLRRSLQDAGFEVRDGPDLLAELPTELTTWKPDPHIAHGARNHNNALQVCTAIADGLGSLPASTGWSTSPSSDTFDIFLGGDCSITPAILTGLHRLANKSTHQPKIGILYMDGDVDLTLPCNDPFKADGSSYILDSMVLTHLTQRPGGLDSMSTFVQPDGSPLVNNENIVLFGFDPLQPSAEHFTYLLEQRFKSFSRPTVRADSTGSAKAALDWLKERVDVILLHFDVDVIDSGDFPLANYPHYAGVQAGEAWDAVKVFLEEEMVRGVVVTEVNPNNDPEGWMVKDLVNALTDGLAERSKLG